MHMPLSNNNDIPQSSNRDIQQRILNLANKDFCPWLNQYVYWLKQPIGWLIVAAAASFLIGMFLAPQGWVMFTALACVILLGVARPWIAIRGVSCDLKFNRRRASEGDCIKIILSVKNRFPWPIWGLSVEGGFFLEELSTGADSTAVALARVPGWATTDFEWEFQPHRRGLYPSGISRISSAFPFGIWHANKIIQIKSELIVWPRTVKLASAPLVKGKDLTATGNLMDQAGCEGDVLAVRPYRRGDPLKQVHWAQTARHSRLIVCERQAPAHRKVEVVIDTDIHVHQTLNQDSSLEWAIRVGASLIKEFHEHGWNVSYLADKKATGTTINRESLKSTFDALAMIQPAESDDIFQRYAGLNSHKVMRVIITTSKRMAQLPALDTIQSGTQFVVLQNNGALPREDSWLTIDCKKDIPAQLQTQWERLCHDTESRA